MDDFDRAQQLEQIDRDIALKQHAARAKVEPRADCSDCGCDLETHRQQYGRCFECQDAREKRAKLYGQG